MGEPAREQPAASGTATNRSWEARPVLARLIRLAVVLAPISLGMVAAVTANHWLPLPSGALVAIVRALGIVALSSVVVWGVDRFARKLLPLAALMQLSLVFPDQAPSRFRSALKSGSSRRLERTLDQTRRFGLAKDPGDAARQVVQLIGAIGDHDRRTRGHSERVRLYADLVGQELKLSKEDRQKRQWGALLHDLGKLMVPAEILNKKGKPDPEEWAILQGHPAAGMELIEPMREFLGEWVHAIGGHHEKWDGSGYPAGLRGRQIPRAAAIVAVADSYEVMTAVRSYKKAMSVAEARAELTRCAGAHFSPEVVRAFLNISLGHLRIVSGPLAALAHLPFLGSLTQLPAAAAAVAPTMVSSAAVPAAAMVTAASLVLSGTPTASALELTGAAPTTAVAVSATEGSPKSSSSSSNGSAAVDGMPAADGASAASAAADTPVVSEQPASAQGTTTTTSAAASAGSSGSPATSAAPTGAAPAATTTTAPRITTTTVRWSTTTTAVPPAPATTAAPPATSPPTVPVTTTTTHGGRSTYQVRFARESSPLVSDTLSGKSLARGTRIYVFMMDSVDRVDYTYPGGSRRANDWPFNMLGGSVFSPTAWTVPSTPGVYTITATIKPYSGSDVTLSTSFTVT